MHRFRIAAIGTLLAAALLGATAGCQTEHTKRTVEVDRAGGATKVKKTETHKTDKGTETRVETKKYRD